MSREAFHLLLERYLQGECTEEEKRMVEELYGMLDKRDLDEIDFREINTIEQKLWDRIHVEISTTEVPVVSTERPERRFVIGTLVRIAAVVTGLLIITGYLFFKTTPHQPDFLDAPTGTSKIYTNNSKEAESYTLEDGSLVVLQPKSQLRVPVPFNKVKREVALSGTAFFDVQKDASRPFLVYSKDLITTVVGTSFCIKADKNGKETEVIVKTGKVIVAPLAERSNLSKKLFGGTNPVVLTANLKTVFSADEKDFETALVSSPEPVYAKEQKAELKHEFSFNDAPVAEVIKTLHDAYGIRFVVKDRALYNNTFTGDLSEQTLYNRLDFLCQSIHAAYEISGTSIVIKSK